VNHTCLAGTFGTLFGLPLGSFLATSRAGELFPAPAANRILGLIVNATRSTPFIILVVAIVPLTRLIAGTSIGTRAAVVPLTIAAIPFIARVIEAAHPRSRSRLGGSCACVRGQPAADRSEGASARGAAVRGARADAGYLKFDEQARFPQGWRLPKLAPLRHADGH
jgi:hypothetical protein